MNLPDEKREAVLSLIREQRKPRPRCRDCADMLTGRCQDDPNRERCDPDEALTDALAPLLAEWLAAPRGEALTREDRRSLAAVYGYETGHADGLAEGEARVRARVEAVLAEGPDAWDGYETHDIGHAFLAESVTDFTADLRAALDADTAETTGGGA